MADDLQKQGRNNPVVKGEAKGDFTKEIRAKQTRKKNPLNITGTSNAKVTKPLTSGATTRRRATKYDWDKIREFYVTNDDSLTIKDVSDHFGMSYDTVRNKASEERWTYLRADFQTRQRQKNQEKRILRLAEESISFDDSSLKAAKIGQTLILGRLGQMASLFQAHNMNFQETLEKIRRKEPVELHELRSAINYKELTELANALDRFQTVGRRALGTDTQTIDINAVLTGSTTEKIQVQVGEELQKPDLDRMAATVEAMRRAGLQGLFENTLELEAGSDDSSDEGVGEGAEDDVRSVQGGGTVPLGEDIVDAEIVG